jgi:hypothetical protein
MARPSKISSLNILILGEFENNLVIHLQLALWIRLHLEKLGD